MNAVERVKKICKERKIPISRLESDCGFANGYIGQLRKGVFPNDRLETIAKYLNLSIQYLMGWDEEQIRLADEMNKDNVDYYVNIDSKLETIFEMNLSENNMDELIKYAKYLKSKEE